MNNRLQQLRTTLRSALSQLRGHRQMARHWRGVAEACRREHEAPLDQRRDDLDLARELYETRLLALCATDRESFRELESQLRDNGEQIKAVERRASSVETALEIERLYHERDLISRALAQVTDRLRRSA